MKKMLIGLVILSLSSTSFAVQSSQQTKKVTKKQISSSIANKSCLQARKTLINNGWKPNVQNSDYEPTDSQKVIMRKYADLESCAPTGYGECNGVYKRGNQYLLVTYSAEGSLEGFESPSCGVVNFQLSNSPF